MPLLFYLPFIVWMGLCDVLKSEMQQAAPVKARKRRHDRAV